MYYESRYFQNGIHCMPTKLIVSLVNTDGILNNVNNSLQVDTDQLCFYE